MSVQLALGVVGGVVGAFFGAPQLGFALGSLVGAAVTPKQKIQGAKLDDLSAPKLQYGQAIPRVYGTERVSGVPIWVSDLQPHENSEDVGGKGGGQEVTTTSYTVDCIFLLMIDTPCIDIARVWVNKKLVYSVGPDSTAELRSASESTTSWVQIGLSPGDLSQMPWATYEAAVGIGNAPAYRQRTTVNIYQLNLGTSGQFPLVEFEVYTEGSSATGGYRDTFPDGLTPFTGDTGGVYFTALSTVYAGAIQVEATTAGAGSHQIEKPISPLVLAYGMRCKFQTAQIGADDSGVLILFNGLFTHSFSLVPRRETGIDPTNSCHIGVSGNELAFSAAGALADGIWYEVQVDLNPGAFGTVARLYDLSGGNILLDTVTFAPAILLPLTVDRMQFLSEGTLGSGASVYADLRLLGLGSEINPVDLQDIVEAELGRVLDPSEFDASALGGIEVTGYATTASPRATLEELASMYYFEAYCTDKLYIVNRGGASAATLTYGETGAGIDQASEPFNGMDRANDLEVPAFYSVVAPDYTRDYEPQSVMSDRLVTQSRETRQVTTTVVLSPSEAKGRADSIARDARISAHSWITTFDLKHIARTPTDVVTLTDVDGHTYRSRILRTTFTDWVFKHEGVLDDVNALSFTGVAPPDGEPSITVTAIGPTFLELVDAPILRDDDDDAGMYGATLIPDGTSIGGSRVRKSVDNVTFTTVVDIPEQALAGACLTALPDCDTPYQWDHVSVFQVQMNAALSSSTKAAMQADRTINVMAVQSGDGWEYIRFVTATLVATLTYDLSILQRGARGTERFMDGHSSSDRVLVMRNAGVRRLPGQSIEIGVNRYWKGVSIGGLDQASTAFVNNAVGLLPFSPAHLQTARDGSGNITFTVARRTRLLVRHGGPGGTLAPLGEDSEAYQIDIFDGPDVVRTLSSNASPNEETLSYSAAEQTTDFGAPVAAGSLDVEAFQISAVVGRGSGLSKTV